MGRTCGGCASCTTTARVPGLWVGLLDYVGPRTLASIEDEMGVCAWTGQTVRLAADADGCWEFEARDLVAEVSEGVA